MRRGAPRADELLVKAEASFDFPVRFTRGIFSRGNAALLELLRRREPERRQRCLLVVDAGAVDARPELLAEAEGFFRRQFAALELAAPLVVAEGGEAGKSRPELPARLRAKLAAAGLGRQSHLVVLGGGALLDAASLAGASFRGGLRVTRLPSTTLAQAEAGIALRCGANEDGRRNAASTLWPPFAVAIDFGLLRSLAERERRAGLAAALRAGLVADAALFHWLADNASGLAAGDAELVENAIRWSVRLHVERLARAPDIVADERGPFALGSWGGAALEDLSGGRLLHGEALAVGVGLDALLSSAVCGLPARVAQATLTLLAEFGFRLWDESLERADERGRPLLLEGLRGVREAGGGSLRLPLLADIGRPLASVAVTENDAVQALAGLRRRPRRHTVARR